MHGLADRVGQRLPAGPVILGHAVLDGDDGIALAEIGIDLDHLVRRQRLALAFQHILAVLEEFGRGRIQREEDILAQLVAGLLHRLGNKAQRFVRRFQVGRETALVADIGVVAGIVQRLLQGVENLRAHAQRLRGRWARPPA